MPCYHILCIKFCLHVMWFLEWRCKIHNTYTHSTCSGSQFYGFCEEVLIKLETNAVVEDMKLHWDGVYFVLCSLKKKVPISFLGSSSSEVCGSHFRKNTTKHCCYDSCQRKRKVCCFGFGYGSFCCIWVRSLCHL